MFFICSIVMNNRCPFRTWPYSCIWLCNMSSLKEGSIFSLIAILHSLLKLGVLRLLGCEVFGIVSFDMAINVSVKCFIRTVLFGFEPIFCYIRF